MRMTIGKILVFADAFPFRLYQGKNEANCQKETRNARKSYQGLVEAIVNETQQTSMLLVVVFRMLTDNPSIKTFLKRQRCQIMQSLPQTVTLVCTFNNVYRNL